MLLVEVLFHRPAHLLSGCFKSSYAFTEHKGDLVLHACPSHLSHSQQNKGFFLHCLELTFSTAGVCRLLGNCTACVWLSLQNSMILSAAIFITLLGLLGYLHFVKIDQETLLIIDSLGIQLTSSYASGKESTTFIEMGKVKDVIINEAIYMVSF